MLLKAEGLNKTYQGRMVVKSMNLNVSLGEVVGLLGPNGAGKTTSFYMIVGLVQVDSGNIYLDKENVTSYPLFKRATKGIGYLPQEASIFRDLSVEANIYAVLENRSISSLKRRNILESLLAEFGLLKIRKSIGKSVSGGERRRVEIARALALEPKFILLDEPFAGIDPLAVGDIQKTIIGLKNRNIGVLITDHNVRETLGIVDRAYVMNQGELLVDGRPDDLIEDERVKKFYLGDEFKM